MKPSFILKPYYVKVVELLGNPWLNPLETSQKVGVSAQEQHSTDEALPFRADAIYEEEELPVSRDSRRSDFAAEPGVPVSDPAAWYLLVLQAHLLRDESVGLL